MGGSSGGDGGGAGNSLGGGLGSVANVDMGVGFSNGLSGAPDRGGIAGLMRASAPPPAQPQILNAAPTPQIMQGANQSTQPQRRTVPSSMSYPDEHDLANHPSMRFAEAVQYTHRGLPIPNRNAPLDPVAQEQARLQAERREALRLAPTQGRMQAQAILDRYRRG